MRNESTISRHPETSARARLPRARSLPSARPFRVAVAFSGVHYLGLVATVTALVVFFLEPGPAAARMLLGGMAFSVFSWVVALIKRRGVHCPLCKGTPLVNGGARTHIRARRLYPLNHGVTAVLSILAAQRFRCMYCGSDYDLLKPSSRLHGHGDSPAGHDEALAHESRS